MVKASDFRSVFPGVTQASKVYRHTRERPNQPVKGANSSLLKFAPSLCQQCNNARTQAHDRAWEALSAALRVENPPLKRGDELPLKRIFGEAAGQSMLAVHHYFLKLFGCYAVEHQVPLPTKAFSVAIMSDVPHPHVYLSFVAVQPNSQKGDIWVGDIEAINSGNQTVCANWFYILGALGVHVAYIEPGQPRLRGHRGWHPDDAVLRICMR